MMNGGSYFLFFLSLGFLLRFTIASFCQAGAVLRELMEASGIDGPNPFAAARRALVKAESSRIFNQSEKFIMYYISVNALSSA